MYGINKCVMAKPPTIKQHVAMSEGTWRFDNPMIACPDVQPPAQRVPKPTIKPPITKKIRPLSEKRTSALNKSVGIRPAKSVIPKARKSAMVLSESWNESGFSKKLLAVMPPKNTPSTNTKFQISFFQSYLKNGILAGTHAAHTCRSDDEIPKDLLPMSKSVGTVRPISGPATYQGQGLRMMSKSCSIWWF